MFILLISWRDFENFWIKVEHCLRALKVSEQKFKVVYGTLKKFHRDVTIQK